MPRAQREEQILAAAAQVFAERGYSATTMEDIAERVGVTKPLLYGYFGSKEGLLSAAVTRARTELREATEQAWASVGDDAATGDVLRAGVRAYFDFIDEHADGFRLMQQEWAVASQAGDLVESIRREQSAATARILRRAPGLVAVPDLVLVGYAEVVTGACERVAVWRSRRRDISAQEATDIVMSSVWGGIGSLLAD